MANPLLAPSAGIPPLVISQSGLAEVISELLKGSGPIAVDAERASGYKYSARAYLIQIKRNGGGLHLLDPIAIGTTDLWKEMSDSFQDEEWIIHASTQDLPCLRELGINPTKIFDTELGGRIAGCERVGLGPLTESLLEVQLAKEHSAVDWSIRPLREEWLNYAALDVELLVELRDEVWKLLESQGKLEWALTDFAAILAAPPPPPRENPWRRTSGMHKVRDRRTLGIIRDLWQARDSYARAIDLAPGRVFNDETLVDVATKRPTEIDEFKKIIQRRSRVVDPPIKEWFAILQSALSTPESELPELRTPSNGLPPVKLWATRNPLGFARVTHARAAVAAKSLELSIPVENLISPEAVRRLCWAEPPADIVALGQVGELGDLGGLGHYVSATLLELGVRPWQISQTGPELAVALLATEPLVIAPDPEEEAAGPAVEAVEEVGEIENV